MLLNYKLLFILFNALLVTCDDRNYKQDSRFCNNPNTVYKFGKIDFDGYNLECTGEGYYSFVCIDKNANTNNEYCIHVRRDSNKFRNVIAVYPPNPDERNDNLIISDVNFGVYTDRDECVEKMKSFENKGDVCEWVNGEMNCRLCLNGDKEWWNF